MARKYLNDIGLDDILVDIKPTDKKWEKWQEEIKEYGFPSYETWCLDYHFYGWLYERLKMYLEFAGEVINLDFHKFEFEGKEYTQRELIEKMIRGCEIALQNDGELYMVESEEDKKLMKDVPWIWATVICAMWW